MSIKYQPQLSDIVDAGFNKLDDRVTSLEYDIKKCEIVIEELRKQLELMGGKLDTLHIELEASLPRRIRLRNAGINTHY
jgi:chromosome segregation ATPase